MQENLELLSYTFLLFTLYTLIFTGSSQCAGKSTVFIYIPIFTGSSQCAGKSKVALSRQSNFLE